MCAVYILTLYFIEPTKMVEQRCRISNDSGRKYIVAKQLQNAFMAFSESLSCGDGRYLLGKILTFDSFSGPLLPETLSVQNIPLPQIREITVSLSGKIAFF